MSEKNEEDDCMKKIISVGLLVVGILIMCTAGVFATDEADGSYNFEGNYTVIVNTGFCYTGQEICPEVIVFNNELINDDAEYCHSLYDWYKKETFTPEDKEKYTLSTECYKVEYVDNIDTGRATVKVSGIEPYTGEISTQFYIYSSKLPTNTVVNDNYSVSLITNLPAEEFESLSFDGRDLIKDTDFTVTDGEVKVKYSYLKGKKRMACSNLKHNVHVVYKNHYMNCKVMSYNLSGVAYSTSSLVYSGKTKSPISITGNSLKKGRDYKVVYDKKNRSQIGEYSYTIKAIEPFVGKIKGSYKVNPKQPKLKSCVSKKSSIKLTWSKVTNCTGYEILILKEVSDDGDEPSYKKIKKITIKDKKTTTKTIKVAKSKYSDVKIRAYKTVNGKKFYSSWKHKSM